MKLKRLEVSSFGGISPDSPIVIDFSESKLVKASGDNGTNKTSLLNSLLVACGQLSKDNKDFINNTSGKIDINFSFVGNDRKTYEVRVTKSSFKLSYEGENLTEPISKMKELLGVVGISPMEIKNSPLRDIVKWLSSYSTKSAEEFEKQSLKLKNGIKLARDSRALANKSMKALKEYLENEPMFSDWEGSEKKYSKVTDINDLSAKLDKAGKNSDKLLQAETKLKQLKDRKDSIDDQISRLMLEAEEIQKSIAIGEKYVEDNKEAKKEYDEIKMKYDNAAHEVVAFNKWQEIKIKKKERDEFETASQKADSQEKDLLKQMKELQAEILPDLKGIDIILEDTHENGHSRQEGLYWNDKNVAQLSQSEWWSVVMAIWRKYKVKIVIIDNFSELGTLAVDMLTKLANDGAYILTAEMQRNKKTLEILYE